jgi:hypothetical protein
MNLTKEQKKRLAKEAEKLAMECVEGTAPVFHNHAFWFGDQPLCALAHVEARAGVPRCSICWPMEGADSSVAEESIAVTASLDEAWREKLFAPDYASAAVFPLLYLADGLTRSARK